MLACIQNEHTMEKVGAGGCAQASESAAPTNKALPGQNLHEGVKALFMGFDRERVGIRLCAKGIGASVKQGVEMVWGKVGLNWWWHGSFSVRAVGVGNAASCT